MSEPPREPKRALDEAADWFTRLSGSSITTAALREFREWRRDPENRDAYERVERTWAASGRLAQDPEIRAAIARSGRRGRAFPPWAWPAAAAAGVAVAVLGTAAGLALRAPAYETGVGEQRVVRLADGSVVRLNALSRIVVRLGARERRVELQRGEALFQVAHDRTRPFRVRADGAEVTAVGTQFDVDRRGPSLEVTLLDGVVRVTGPDQTARILAPSQAVRLSGGRLALPKSVVASEAVSWTQGRLVFHDTPLGEAIDEVNRYAARPVRLDAPSLAGERVSGVFTAGDTNAFVDAVAAMFDLKVKDDADSYRLGADASA